MILLMMGELAAAHTHLVEATSLYGRHSPSAATFRGVDDPGVRCHIDAGLVLWCLGYPDQALQQSRHGLSLAEKLAYPLNLASAWHLSGMLHQLRGESAMARKYAEALLGLSTAQDISPPRAAGGLMLHGWTVAVQGKYEEGLTHIWRGLTQWEAAGSRLLRPYALATLAGVYLQSGQPALGLALVEKALAMVNVTGESWYEAELYRLQGELTLAEFHGPDREARAEVIWRNALAVARGQDARSWELRVAMSLARLWERQGKRREARNLLAPIYGWFTEGHDTEDLKQAKTLLDAMS
jgi:adenylate cyclase